MAKPLRIALTKGRLEKDTVGLLERLAMIVPLYEKKVAA